MATGAPYCFKLLLLFPKSSTLCRENCIFLFSLNQLRPKWHSKFRGRNLETRESPNLRKYPILQIQPKQEEMKASLRPGEILEIEQRLHEPEI